MRDDLTDLDQGHLKDSDIQVKYMAGCCEKVSQRTVLHFTINFDFEDQGHQG